MERGPTIEREMPAPIARSEDEAALGLGNLRVQLDQL